ncbi:hypothetical protein KEU06_08755 [Pseudaminobacter sp. 19-2017]|uniref:Uncharacterized protein n=1 Tax=Pseudaminobacter soli (ex Zhang et al. 2022) TaxID=2831468 RepID=A0A942E588_9HYPH|nr:hypothetical protein [Pseudaminobacter soli]MBS3648717.1 hypothetical protein [Pseudaminobacter soli]
MDEQVKEKVFVEENRIVVEEYRQDDKIRLEVFLDGQGVAKDQSEQITTSMAVVAAMFSLYTDGTVLERMNQMFGIIPGTVEMKLENANGYIPGHT